MSLHKNPRVAGDGDMARSDNRRNSLMTIENWRKKIWNFFLENGWLLPEGTLRSAMLIIT
jgi:hypothetical protein